MNLCMFNTVFNVIIIIASHDNPNNVIEELDKMRKT